MNAKELHRLMVAGRIALVDPTTSHPHLTQEIVHRALSLLAAAEANDGTTPETDNPSNIDSWRATKDTSRRLERERDGLARSYADALEENARLKAELAKLRQHAEAMAEHWEKDDTMNMMQSAVDAYRRDYPEGTK